MINKQELKPYLKEAADLIKNGHTKASAFNIIIKKYSLEISIRSLYRFMEEIDIEDDHYSLAEFCKEKGVNIKNVDKYWLKNGSISAYIKVPGSDEVTFDELRQAFIEDLKKFAPVYPTIKRSSIDDPHLLIVDPADLHFGKYSTVSETGEETSTSVTKKRFSEGIDGLIDKVKGYKFDKIIYVGGNDIAHVDNPFNTTTKGTRQDVDGLWYESYLVGKQSTIEALDKLLTIADVHFVFCPSNHDYITGFFLADAISSHYANNKNITFDVTPMHRKYIQYGKSLIGFTHADGAKEGDLPDLMKREAKQAYSISKYNYWLCHHIHHKITNAYKGTTKVKLEKDHRDVTVINTGLSLIAEDYCHVEYVRTLTGTDSWHAKYGFLHAPKAMEAFIFHPLYGQVNRISHLF